MQEASDDSDSDSDDEWANETFVEMPETKVKKLSETVFEESDSDSEYDEESDTEKQPSTSRRKQLGLQMSQKDRLISMLQTKKDGTKAL